VPKKGERNLKRLKQAHAAYVRYGNLARAAKSLKPPVTPDYFRRMLQTGSALGLFRNPHEDGRKRSLTKQRIQRLLEIKRLYEELGSLRAAGRALCPPISGPRVRQLLIEGAQLEILDYAGKQPVKYSMRMVENVILEAGSVEEAARRLKISPQRIRREYARALRVLPKARLRKRREKAMALYLSLAYKSGYYPEPTNKGIGRNLHERIIRAFGSITAFIKDIDKERS
jgi:hypothetical protein